MLGQEVQGHGVFRGEGFVERIPAVRREVERFELRKNLFEQTLDSWKQTLDSRQWPIDLTKASVQSPQRVIREDAIRLNPVEILAQSLDLLAAFVPEMKRRQLLALSRGGRSGVRSRNSTARCKSCCSGMPADGGIDRMADWNRSRAPVLASGCRASAGAGLRSSPPVRFLRFEKRLVGGLEIEDELLLVVLRIVDQAAQFVQPAWWRRW